MLLSYASVGTNVQSLEDSCRCCFFKRIARNQHPGFRFKIKRVIRSLLPGQIQAHLPYPECTERQIVQVIQVIFLQSPYNLHGKTDQFFKVGDQTAMWIASVRVLFRAATEDAKKIIQLVGGGQYCNFVFAIYHTDQFYI